MKDISESYLVAALLSITGGFLDAYTFVSRDGVFANAQTGNFARLAISIANGSWEMAIRYLIPIIFFIIGVSVAIWVSRCVPHNSYLHWKQYTLILEIILLLIVSWIPYGKFSNICANILISFTCAIQAESFRKVLGTPFASTMYTGNLRNATEYLNQFFIDKEKTFLQKSGQYFGIDILFVLGAVAGTLASKIYKTRATIFCCILLFIVLFVMKNNDVR